MTKLSSLAIPGFVNAQHERFQGVCIKRLITGTTAPAPPRR